LIQEYSTERFLKPYLTGLSSTIRTVKNVQELYEPVNAFRFNLFNFWYPGENKLSQLLAFFLDPKQTHGQGDTFLNIFLNKFNLSQFVSDTNNIRVKCEHALTFQRRIDILISFYNDGFAIAIENKFGAPDQGNQLHDYANYLKANFKQHILFYLTPKGQRPSEASISSENFDTYVDEGSMQAISYTENIIDLIHDWGLACRAERVRHFLNDFEQYFKQELIGDTFMNEHKIVADYALSTQENLAAAFETFKAFDTVKDEVGKLFTDKLTHKLQDIFKEDGWSVIQYGNLNVVVTRASWPDNIFVGIRDFDNDRVHFSVKAENVDSQALYLHVKNQIGGSFNNNCWWLRLVPAYNRWDDKLEGITALYNLSEEAITYMSEGVIQVVNSVDIYLAK